MKWKEAPWTVRVLWILLGFQAVSALWGGFLLIVNPSGSFMRFPPDFLERIPFPSFRIPGFILFFFLGVIPALSLIGLIRETSWKRVERFNLFPRAHWAWTGSMYTAVMLILWIVIQAILLGFRHFIQAAYGLTGVLILAFTLLPPVRNRYTK